MSSQKTIYLTKGYSRKEQIYNWFKEVTIENNLQHQLRDIMKDILEGNGEYAYKRFKEFVNVIINLYYTQGIVLGYLIEENINKFGERTIIDLFKGVFGVSPIMTKKKTKKYKPSTQIEQIEKQFKKEQQKFFYGINTTTTKKEKAEINIVLIRDKPQYRLRSIKTGKFLKFTDTFKKEVKKKNL